MTRLSVLVTLYAALLALCGTALLFAPAEVGALVDGEAGGTVVAQLLGAALLGLAVTAGVARRSILGGIYGRAVVAGHQAFAVVGALTLLGNRPAQAGAGYVVLLGVLLAGAGLFSRLLVRGPRPEA